MQKTLKTTETIFLKHSCVTFIKGFTEGFIKFGNGDVKIIKKPIPDGKFTGDSMIWHFCCREDGSWKDPVYLPTKEPFTLFPTDSECQEVKGYFIDCFSESFYNISI